MTFVHLPLLQFTLKDYAFQKKSKELYVISMNHFLNFIFCTFIIVITPSYHEERCSYISELQQQSQVGGLSVHFCAIIIAILKIVPKDFKKKGIFLSFRKS